MVQVQNKPKICIMAVNGTNQCPVFDIPIDIRLEIVRRRVDVSIHNFSISFNLNWIPSFVNCLLRCFKLTEIIIHVIENDDNP